MRSEGRSGLDVDVVVVGAGLCGLTAADRIESAGYAVQVIEARDRIGGRTLSVRSDSTVVELGAQWVGQHHIRVRRMCAELGLTLIPVAPSGDRVTDIDGEAVRDHGRRLGALPGLLDQVQVGARMAWLTWRSSHRGSARLGELDQISAERWIASGAWTKAGADYWRYIIESGTCARADEISIYEVARQLASMGGLRGLATAEAFTIEDGTQRLAEGLADQLANPVMLGRPVESIRSAPGTDRVEVDCRRETLNARRVVVAVPAATLQSVEIDPSLGATSPLGVDAPVAGRVVKQVIVYESRWWRQRGLSGEADTPGRCIDFMTDSSQADGPGVLVALSTGPRADRMSRLNNADRERVTLAHINDVLGASPDPVPTIRFHDWIHDPHAQGGYAARRRIGGWATSVREPEGCDRLVFASTETATQWRSYMEGAIDAGEQAAALIVGGLTAASTSTPLDA